ncbi:cullin-associated NEDD8-dissociated protein 1-like isoform X2 [Oncorhynchus nerka]
MKVILPTAVQRMEDPFYKITSETLLVTQQMIRHPLGDKLPASSFDVKPYVKDLFAGTLKRLQSKTMKWKAISCMGHVSPRFSWRG